MRSGAWRRTWGFRIWKVLLPYRHWMLIMSDPESWLWCTLLYTAGRADLRSSEPSYMSAQDGQTDDRVSQAAHASHERYRDDSGALSQGMLEV
jgi:hypothetical protein